MKINRLLAIVTYLLNRDIVSGKHLAEKFEVSERTIQRDIDTINMAGIPIVSLRGVNGGYKIMDSYRLSKQTSSNDDLRSILVALKGLNSVLDDQEIASTMEKVVSISGSNISQNMSIDFGVAKENKKINNFIKVINRGIHSKYKIEFSYTNAEGLVSSKRVEPVLLQFKWYAWYLVAYCTKNERYQIFKLIRMNDLKKTNFKCSYNHNYNEKLFDDLMHNDNRKYMHIIFKCNKNVLIKVLEYLPTAKVIQECEQYYDISLTVPENEHMWFAMLISFGDTIEVLSPECLKKKLVEHSKKIIDQYRIPDK